MILEFCHDVFSGDHILKCIQFRYASITASGQRGFGVSEITVMGSGTRVMSFVA